MADSIISRKYRDFDITLHTATHHASAQTDATACVPCRSSHERQRSAWPVQDVAACGLAFV